MPKTLNDVCEFIVDCLHATAPTQDEGYPLIRTPNIGKGRLNLGGVYRVSEDTYEKWTRRAVPQENDLILAREATAGNVVIVKNGQQVCLGQRTVHLRPDAKQVDPDFLCYHLLAPQQQGALLAGETGATSKHVNMKDIRRLPLKDLPDRDVQQAIGRVISAYDDLIENNRRRIQLLEKAARLLYKEWFVHLRFPGHEHVTITDGVPEGWEAVRLQDITSVVTKGTTPTSLGKAFTDEGINFIKVESVEENGGLLDSKFAHIDESTHNLLRRSQLYEGDILFSIAGAIGRSALVPTRMLPANTNQALAIIRVRDPELRVFLFLTVRSAQFQNYSLGRVVQTAQKNVSLTALKEARVIMPNKTIMVAFLQQAGELQSMLWTLREQNNKLVNARDLLLPRLMNGEVAV